MKTGGSDVIITTEIENIWNILQSATEGYNSIVVLCNHKYKYWGVEHIFPKFFVFDNKFFGSHNQCLENFPYKKISL